MKQEILIAILEARHFSDVSFHNVAKGEEVSAPHHKFVKKYNEVNEKYNLRYKPIG